MHPLVRDLYKRVILVGRDYPHPEGINYIRKTWKTALHDPQNCPAYYNPNATEKEKERDLKNAVKKGRFMVNEMVGVIQLKKYRTMKKRYSSADGGNGLEEEMKRIQNTMKEANNAKRQD